MCECPGCAGLPNNGSPDSSSVSVQGDGVSGGGEDREVYSVVGGGDLLLVGVQQTGFTAGAAV